jgi:nucleoside-diphosphate-sugar epimerase
VLVIGCGYLGRRAAARWVAAGRRVAAVTRSRAGELAAAGLEPVTADVLDPASLAAVPAASTLLYAVGYDRTAGAAMRDVYVGGLANVLRVVRPPERIIYVSSTGVYGRTDGGEADEGSPVDPTEASGKVVADAERTLLAARPDAVILRFAGIYGPGRVLRRAALLAGEPLIGDADKWLNLIHVEDGAAAVLRAEAAAPGETFNVSDGEPVTRRAFYTLAAELLGAPPARFEPPPPGSPPEPNRRVSNRRLQDRLGWRPAYPSYREGLAASVVNG